MFSLLWQKKSVIAINPSFFEVHIALGMIYGQDGLFDDAIAMFKAALAIRSDDAEVWNDLGFTYYLKGLHRKTIEQYRRGAFPKSRKYIKY